MTIFVTILVLAVLALLYGVWFDRRHRGRLRDSREMSAAADRNREGAVGGLDDRGRHGGSFGGSL